MIWRWICLTQTTVFVMAFPAETTEAFMEAHALPLHISGGVPTRILYDNTKIAMARILGGEERQKTRIFSELESYDLFAINDCRRHL